MLFYLTANFTAVQSTAAVSKGTCNLSLTSPKLYRNKLWLYSYCDVSCNPDSIRDLFSRIIRAAPFGRFRSGGVSVSGGAFRSPADSYLTWCAEQSPPRPRRSWWDRWGVCTAKGRASAAGSSPTQELSPTFSGSCDHWQLTRPPALALCKVCVYFQFKYIYRRTRFKDIVRL